MKSIMMASALILLSATAAFAQLPLPLPTPTPTPAPTPTPPPPPVLPITVPVTLTVAGNEAFGSFDIGGIGADIKIKFENVVGLVPTAFDVTATLVNPIDPALLTRLPIGGLVGVPIGFPVVIRIGPSADSGLSFEGMYEVSFHTHNLHLDVNVPFSLFKSPDGGAFKDITKSEGRGSYRDDGGGGDFSDFLIVIDLQPIDAVIAAKFDDLQSTITNNAGSMPPDVVATLQTDLASAHTLYQSGAIRDAIDAMRVFSRYVKAHSGEDIPDVWRANCSPLVNVAGLLRSGADTLRFSLDRKLSQ
ncbi:MAG: hypothetical protein DMF82_21050 [Acidobacteria bacterium]|nr:MAG: hypothetical protein DMF82_21050 [Acidobacteriota bacterium]